MPTMTIKIPRSLHNALPQNMAVTNRIRHIIADAIDHPHKLPSAFASRLKFEASPEELHRYSVYVTEEERIEGTKLASRFLLSYNQMVQILLEDLLFQAGKWPVNKASSSSH